MATKKLLRKITFRAGIVDSVPPGKEVSLESNICRPIQASHAAPVHFRVTKIVSEVVRKTPNPRLTSVTKSKSAAAAPRIPHEARLVLKRAALLRASRTVGPEVTIPADIISAKAMSAVKRHILIFVKNIDLLPVN